MSEAKTTTDHSRIRNWIDDRDGRPSKVTAGGSGGILRVDFGEPDEALTPIAWEEFLRSSRKTNWRFSIRIARTMGR
jgi:hypothetical protein